jgi:hypothetical protein
MTQSGLTPDLLQTLQAVDSDWRMLPCDGRKRPVDPETGEVMTAWGQHTYDADGIAAFAGNRHVRSVGLALGEISGVIAVDFDGDGSKAMFVEVYGRGPSELPKTVAWTSGRPNRRQLAFRVPVDLWIHLRGRRYWSIDGRVVLEVRGTGHQSIICGEHPDTNGYEWIEGRSPEDVGVADAPEWLLAPMYKAKAEPVAAEYQPTTAADIPRALDLLAHIPPQDAYDPWLEVGMALHSVDPGLLLDWVDWSRGSANFDEEECLKKWQSFKGGGITIGKLHFFAAQAGYTYRRPVGEAPAGSPDHFPDAGNMGESQPQPATPSKDQQIQTLLDSLLNLRLEPADQWAKEQAIRSELYGFGIRGDAIDDRLLVALAARWGLPLAQGHSGQRRGRSITDPLDSPAEDLVPGFLLWRRDHLIFGAGGAGKTMAAAAMAAAVIKGLPFLDQEIPVDADKRGRVLWIGTDGGEGARAMVLEYLEDLGLDEDQEIVEGLEVWSAEANDSMPPWCCTPRGLLELRNELETGTYSLVVIDSLKAVLELAGINFGIGPVGTLMRFMQALVGRYCSLVWLHHPAGGKASGKGVQAAAGSQNINQIPSGVHQITRVSGDRGACNEWSVLKLRGSQSRDFKYRLAGDGFEVTDGEITSNARSAVLDCLEIHEAMGRPTDTRSLMDDLHKFTEATIRNNLTWLRKRFLIKKHGKAWKLTVAGRKAMKTEL